MASAEINRWVSCILTLWETVKGIASYIDQRCGLALAVTEWDTVCWEKPTHRYILELKPSILSKILICFLKWSSKGISLFFNTMWRSKIACPMLQGKWKILVFFNPSVHHILPMWGKVETEKNWKQRFFVIALKNHIKIRLGLAFYASFG